MTPSSWHACCGLVKLNTVWVPDAAHEAMRDLVRSRADAKRQLKVAKQQLQSFLLRQGRVYSGLACWSRAHSLWLAEQKFDHAAQQIVFQDYINAIKDAADRHTALVKQIERLVPEWKMKPLVEALCVMKGLDLVASSTLLSVTGDLRRFSTPSKLTSYVGLVPSEHSSGDSVKRGGITKAGNNEVRRVLIQAAWCYRFPARVTKQKETGGTQRPRKKVRNIAWRAQVRLCSRYRRFVTGGKKDCCRLYRCCARADNVHLGNGPSGAARKLAGLRPDLHSGRHSEEPGLVWVALVQPWGRSFTISARVQIELNPRRHMIMR